LPDYSLCVITTTVPSRGRGHAAVARAALEGGCRFLQLRDKELSTRRLVEVAQEIRELTHAYGATFVVNDRVDVALAAEADGVHLGEEDMPLTVARRLLGPRAIIGASAATVPAARAAKAEGADYLGVGPVFTTGSKADAGEAVGFAPVTLLKAAVGIPVLGIGGITAANVTGVIHAGADGVAVISTIAAAEDMVEATRALLARIREARDAGTGEEG
jgi:thiamine-phosphate pyrophosphorylase